MTNSATVLALLTGHNSVGVEEEGFSGARKFKYEPMRVLPLWRALKGHHQIVKQLEVSVLTHCPHHYRPSCV